MNDKIKCKRCEKEIDSNSVVCPHCAYIINKDRFDPYIHYSIYRRKQIENINKKFHYPFIFILSLFIIIFLIGIIYTIISIINGDGMFSFKELSILSIFLIILIILLILVRHNKIRYNDKEIDEFKYKKVIGKIVIRNNLGRDVALIVIEYDVDGKTYRLLTRLVVLTSLIDVTGWYVILKYHPEDPTLSYMHIGPYLTKLILCFKKKNK